MKTAVNVIDSLLAYIINKNPKQNKFSENAKTAFVRSIYKKNDKEKTKNYRPVNLLNGFLHNNLSSFTDKMFSKLFQLIESLVV